MTPMDWLDSHAGSVQAVATMVLVVLTAYYAWASQLLVRETRTTLRAAARSTLQARLDRISELFIREPHLFAHLDDPMASGEEEDARFHICNMFLGVLEEAFTQFTFEHSMTADDWSAWQATADMFLPRRYVTGYWERTQHTFEPSFRRFINDRIRATASTPRPSNA
jgi:hypothetical protein